MTFYEELEWRGLVNQISSPELKEKLNKGGMTFYIGTDPTADSLHLGHYSSFLITRRLQKAGHTPILLVGLATGLIGDPRGTVERELKQKEEVYRNYEALKAQVERLFGFEVVNNHDWIKDLNVIDFFRTLPARFSAAKKKPAQDDNDSEFMEVGENGKKIFWIAFACLSPLLLFFLLVYFGFFAALYVAVALAIVFCVIVLVLLVAAGSAVALIGLVYGVIRLFSIPAEGLYEIGLAIIIIGLVMLFGVLIYNLALRVLPLLFRQIKRLFLFTFDKLKALYYYLKKECYKL